MQTRSREVLGQTFNTAPRMESIVQNQKIIVELLCDVRETMNDMVRMAVRNSLKKIESSSKPGEGLGDIIDDTL